MHSHSSPWPFFMMGGGRGRHHGHGPPPWVREMFGGQSQGRAGRGEVRYLILDAIVEQPRHGYEVIQTIEQRSGGAYKPSPGTIYPTLQMLTEMGLASAQPDGNRTVYAITEDGKTLLEAHRDEVDEAYDRWQDDSGWADEVDFRELGRWAKRIRRSLGSAFRRGRLGAEQFKEIGEVLEGAAEKIEKILKKD